MGNPGYPKYVEKKKSSPPLNSGLQSYLEQADRRKQFLAGEGSASQNADGSVRRVIEDFDRTWEKEERQNRPERLRKALSLPATTSLLMMHRTFLRSDRAASIEHLTRTR